MSATKGLQRGLVEPVCIFFEHVDAHVRGKTKAENRIWYQVWPEVLAFTGKDAEDRCLEVLVLMSAAIDRVAAQVHSSRKLSDDNKKRVGSVLTGLKTCVRLSTFGQPVAGHRESFSEDRLGRLRVAADVLNAEVPPVTLSNTAIADLRECADELTALLNGEDVSPLVRELLGPHVRMIKWIVEHVDWFGTEVLMEELFRTGLDAKKALEPAAEPGGDAPAESVSTRFWKLHERLFRIVDSAEKISFLAEKGSQLLELAKQIG